jgi:hypothetical protein
VSDVELGEQCGDIEPQERRDSEEQLDLLAIASAS